MISTSHAMFATSAALVAAFATGTVTGLQAQIASDVMYAHYIDVGQADATLLEFSCGAVLIDAGAQDPATTANLIGYLARFFTERSDLNNTLESVIMTHNHADHTRALREVVEAFTVNRFIENGQRGGLRAAIVDVEWLAANATTGGRNITVLDVDDADIVNRTGLTNSTIDPVACTGTDPELRILSADLAEDVGWDTSGDAFRNKNNHSIVVRIDFGAASFLFTGDLEEPALETLVDYYTGTDMLDVDVYQVGHHGSYNGTTASLLQAMTPDIAVISMSSWDDHDSWTGWAYGHPREVTVNALRAATSRRRVPTVVHIASGTKTFFRDEMRDAIFATGWDGTVKVRATAEGRYRVTRAR